MTLLGLLIKGGWVMIPIAICSLVVIALGVSRWLVIRRYVGELERFLGDWGEAAVASEPARFWRHCDDGPAVVARMAAAAKGDAAGVAARLESEARNALFELEKGMATMATMASVAPLLGFLGTVTGMVRAFMQIQNLGGNVNASVLAGGIWEALITTVAGLVVGIPALLLHNYFAGLIKQAANRMERCGDLIQTSPRREA